MLRINKVLAHAGYGSRRAAEELILQGRVSVDGQVIREMGVRVDPEKSKIEVDGERIKLEKPVYLAVHKPKGYVSTNSDPAGRPRVVDLLPELNERVYTVGRLDEDSTGLILLTNDGQLANRLAHPRYGVEKVYRAQVAGHPEPAILDRLTEGVWLSDGKARARRARFAGKQGDSTIIELVLAEGKNREVRRMLAKLGHKVMNLTRIAVGPIRLKGLDAGQFRHLTPEEVALLHKAASGELVGPPSRRERPSRPEKPARSDRGRSGPPAEGAGLGNLLPKAGEGRGQRPGGPGGRVPSRLRRVVLDEPMIEGQVEGPQRRARRTDQAGPGSRRPGRRDEGPGMARRSARPGLYEPKNYRRAGRDEVEPDEIVVPPVGEGPAEGSPPRRPSRPRPFQGEQGTRKRSGEGGPTPRRRSREEAGEMREGPPPPSRGRRFQAGGPPDRRRAGDQGEGQGVPPAGRGRRPAIDGPPIGGGRRIVGLSPGDLESDASERLPRPFRRAVGPARNREEGMQGGGPAPLPTPRRPKPLKPRRRPRAGEDQE